MPPSLRNKLKDLLSSAKMFRETNPLITDLAEDQDWMTECYEIPDEDENPRWSHWVLRLEFDSNCMESVRASLRKLCGILLVNTLGDVHIISNSLPMPMTMVYAGGHQWMK